MLLYIQFIESFLFSFFSFVQFLGRDIGGIQMNCRLDQTWFEFSCELEGGVDGSHQVEAISILELPMIHQDR